MSKEIKDKIDEALFNFYLEADRETILNSLSENIPDSAQYDRKKRKMLFLAKAAVLKKHNENLLEIANKFHQALLNHTQRPIALLKQLIQSNSSLALYKNLDKLSREDIIEIIKDKNLIELLEQIDGEQKRSNAQLKAQELLENCGLDEITEIPIELFAAGLDLMVIEETMSNCDGKIIFGINKAIIKVNSQIQFHQRKRFVIAHEIGHWILHRNMSLPDDTFANFNIIAGMERQLKNGIHELEANQFASELLMPEKLFVKEAKSKKFSPLLIKQLAERFNTSLTATTFKFWQLDIYPICLVFIENGKVKYTKKSDDMHVWVTDYKGLAPPTDSVAAEYVLRNYDFVYKLDEKAQSIKKSTWFTLSSSNPEDTDCYEYCIPTKRYKTILSIIWED